MLDLQKYFLEFHEKIKLDNFDENQTLRDKRDTLLGDLNEKIDDDAPAFEHFDQGSYAMYIGTNPKDGNYDIDVGVVFDCTSDDYEDPVELKKIVRDSLTHGNRTVRIRRPCVTVEYKKNGEELYAAAAYMSRDAQVLSNLKLSDYGKVIFGGLFVISTILLTINSEWTFIRDLLDTH